MAHSIPNTITHDPIAKTVTITVTRKNGTQHGVIVDDFVYPLIVLPQSEMDFQAA